MYKRIWQVAVRAMIYTESMAGHISSLGQAVSSHTPVLVQGQIGTGDDIIEAPQTCFKQCGESEEWRLFIA